MISVFSIVIIPFRIHIHHMIHQITDSIGYLPFARANATERYRSVSLLVFRQYQSRKMLDIREKYYNEFSKILSQKQILKIYQQEKMNANKFRKEFDRRKGQKPGQGHH